jgi:pyruvate formate lyase activating enzyme
MVVIKGIQKTSLIDYPGKISTIIFTAGCNMRCPFCQNPDLVTGFDQLPDLDEGKIVDFLKERRKWIDGVCITGGEPLIYNDITELITKIKNIGLLVKLDTNGLNPGILEKLIREKLIDYIAMDIKSDESHYEAAAGCGVDMRKIKQSVESIKATDIDYEFRSTIVPDFFNEAIMENIGKWLGGAKKYCIQQFRSSVPLVDKSFEGRSGYSLLVLNRFKEIMEKYVHNVEVRA